MTNAYRRKLLLWFGSVGLLLLTTVLSMLHYWFDRVADSFGRSDDFEFIAGPLGENLVLYILVFPIVGFWHALDFLQRGSPKSPVALQLSAYSTFLAVIAVALFLYLLMAAGVLAYNSCEELDGAFYFQCIVRPSLFLLIPFLIALGIVLGLCIAKAIIAIKSRVTRTA